MNNTLRDNRIKQIEFAGLSGAGKSTLCACILANLSSDTTVCRYPDLVGDCLRLRERGGLPGKLVKALPRAFWEPLIGIDCSVSELHRFQFQHPALMKQLFQILADFEISEEWRSCVLYVFTRLAIERELLDQHASGNLCVLNEEGFVQAVLSMFGYVPLPHIFDAGEIGGYLDNCPLPDGVIWLDTPPEVCLARLKQRVQMPIALACGDALQRLKHFQSCLKMAISELEMRGVEVWRVSYDPDPNMTAAQVAEIWVSKHFQGVCSGEVTVAF